MTEYATAIDVWLEADNEEDATAIAKRLADRVKEHPGVVQVEVQRPEEQ